MTSSGSSGSLLGSIPDSILAEFLNHESLGNDSSKKVAQKLIMSLQSQAHCPMIILSKALYEIRKYWVDDSINVKIK